MAGAPLAVDVQHVFGSHCSAGLSGAALFADDSGHHALYPVGRRVAVRHLETHEVTFIGGACSSACGEDELAGNSVGMTSSVGSSSSPGTGSADSIAFCAISRERTFLALGERRSKEPFNSIAVYDLPSMGSAGPQKSLIECFRGRGPKVRLAAAAFSSDGEARFLAVLSNGPEMSLTVVDWRHDQVLARLRLDDAADRVAWCPQSGSVQISVSGPHLMRVVVLKDALSKVRECTLKLGLPFKGMDETAGRTTDHAWVEPGEAMLVACTAEGKVRVLCAETLTVLSTLKGLFGAERTGAIPVCIRCYSQGFLLGGTEGMVSVWEKDDSIGEGLDFRFLRTSRVARSKAAVMSVDFSGTEESLILGFRSGDVGSMPFANLLAESRGGESLCGVFSGGFHAGPVASLEVAAHRPVVATVGKKDGLIRVWNYATRQCDICWTGDAGDAPIAASMHPFGYFLAVTFNAKVRLFFILAKGLQLHTEISLSGAKAVRFSNGGHLLAIAQGKFVHLFSTRTMTKTTTLQGHAHGISALCFDPEDTMLWTCGSDGQLCCWDALTGERLGDRASLRWEYLAAASAHNGQAVCSLASGGQCLLLRFRGTAMDFEEELPKDVRITSLCQFPGSPFVFAASATGKLYAFGPNQTKYFELGLHSGACTAMGISADGRTLLTAGEDGAIFMLSVTGLAPSGGSGDDGLAATAGSAIGAAQSVAADSVLAASAAEAVLVQRALMQKRIEQCKKLRAERHALKTSLEGERQRLEEECQAKVAETRQKDQAEIQELSRRRDSISSATQAKQRESERIMKSMVSSHTQAAEQLGGLFEKKVSFESDRYAELLAQKGSLEDQIQEAKVQLASQLRSQEEEAQADLHRELAERELEIQKHKDMIAFYQLRFDKLLEDEAATHDIEVADANLQAERQLKSQKDVAERLRTEQGELLSGLEMMEEERVVREKEQQEAAVAIRTLRETKDELTRTLRSLEAERLERQATLEDKEDKVASYKVKVNTLKKFRHVLNKQLQEVTDSLQPKEQTINQLHGSLKELESELERQVLDQRTMERELAQKKQHLTQLQQDGKELKEVIAEKDRFITRYTYDLYGLVHGGEEERKWPQDIRRMYHSFVNDDRVGEDRIPLENMQRQMKQVERRVASLAVKSGQMRTKCKTDIQRKAHENAQLVNDVNILRKERQAMQSSCRALQKRLEELEARAAAGDASPLALTGGGGFSLEAPKPSATTPLPRVPSGSLPGPRQQTAARTAGPGRRSARTRSVPPLGDKAPVRARASEEDCVRMQAIMHTAQSLRGASPELFKSESALLREKIDTLLKNAPSSCSLDSGEAGARPPPVEEHIFAD